MRGKVCHAYLVFSLILLCYSADLFAGDCTIDSNFMDRGEQKAFLICGEDIPSNYTLEGLSDANIAIEYEQYLEQCDVGVETPGIYLILRAEDDTTTGFLNILDDNTGKPACEGLTIEIPDRVNIAEASLIESFIPDFPFLILWIKGSGTQDLSQACAGGISFPEGKWPSLFPLSQQDLAEISPFQKSFLRFQMGLLLWLSQEGIHPSYSIDQPICTNSSIMMMVKVQGQQRYPAKIIVPNLLDSLEEEEGIAYATLPPPAWLSAMKDEDAKYIDVNGIRTRYFEKGRGDALLFVHGGPAGSAVTAQDVEQNFHYLSEYFHVYALDKIGQGYTDNPKTEEDYKEYFQQVVDHVYEFIKAVGIEKVHLVGLSQGGWPVTRIALDHPEMVKSLVNVDGIPTPPGSLSDFETIVYTANYVHPPEGPTLESIRRNSELISYSLNNITNEKVERKYHLSYLPEMIEAQEMMAKYGMHPGSPVYLDLQEEAIEEIKDGKLKVPTLLVWGFNDPLMQYEAGLELFKCITNSDVPGSRLILFDNCGHAPHQEYPELFNRTIKSFCGKYSIKPVD